MNLETKWSVNESLLQSYRSIFISSQSFLLAVGAVLVEQYPYLNIVIAGLSLLMIWWIWIPVVKARRRIVDYYKYALKLNDEQSVLFLQRFIEHDYVKDGTQRREANQFLQEAIGEKKPITDLRETRKKIDIYLPIGFSIIWLLFIIISIVEMIQYLIK
jgi:hypothetical protein